jgi:hypothetical protein
MEVTHSLMRVPSALLPNTIRTQGIEPRNELGVGFRSSQIAHWSILGFGNPLQWRERC